MVSTLTNVSGIKNDFSAQLHKFLASLTDTRWKMEGKTVLYIPNEGLKLEPERAAKDKELVQRLESRASSNCVASLNSILSSVYFGYTSPVNQYRDMKFLFRATGFFMLFFSS